MIERQYGDHALGKLRQGGVRVLHAYCVRPGCSHWSWLSIDDLLKRMDAATTLVMLARKVRCGACGARGAHVQAEPNNNPANAGYREWLDAQLRVARELLARHGP